MFGIGSTSSDNPVAQVINVFFTLLIIAIFIRAILSWFNLDPRSPLILALNSVTEPILDPIRRLMPRLGIDLSPMIAIIVLQVISKGLQSQFG